MISIIIVLALANYLVFSNLLMLLFNASNEAVSRVAATRVPRPALTTLPTVLPPTPTVENSPTVPPTATTEPSSTPTTVSAATALPIVTLSATRSPTQTFTFPFTYTVKAGDTLSGLADRFLVPKKKIMDANGLTDANFIRVGQVLIIPDPNR